MIRSKFSRLQRSRQDRCRCDLHHPSSHISPDIQKPTQRIFHSIIKLWFLSISQQIVSLLLRQLLVLVALHVDPSAGRYKSYLMGLILKFNGLSLPLSQCNPPEQLQILP